MKHGEYSQFVHNRDELLFRWTKRELLVHLLRLWSSVLGLPIFVITWKMSKSVFTNHVYRNLSMLVFFNPMFIHIFSTLTNVALISLISTCIIAIDIAYINKKKDAKIFLLEGLLLGIGYITKISIFGLLLAKGLILFKDLRTSHNIRRKLLESALITGGFATVAGWYILRSFNLYGTLFEQRALARIPGEYVHQQYVQSLGLINYTNSLFTTLFRTFWSGYGAITVKFPDIINLVPLSIALLLVYTIFVKQKDLNSKLRICLYYLVSVFIGLIIMNFMLRAMHAKDLFPAYMPFAFIFGFTFIKLQDILKKDKLTNSYKVISLAILTYFLAQNEIVKILKAAFGITADEKLIILIISLTIKSIIALGVQIIVVKVIRQMSFSQRAIRYYTYALFSLNILTLAISSYLFYFRFI